MLLNIDSIRCLWEVFAVKASCRAVDAFEFIELKGVTGVAVVDDITGKLLTASTGKPRI